MPLFDYPDYQEITGSVNITGSVSLDAQPIKTTGSITVNNFPNVQEITGSVTLSEQPINITGSVNLDKSIPSGNNKIGRFSIVSGSNSNQEVSVIKDSGDNIVRLATVGKVSISPPAPPDDSTSVTIAADTPINVNASSNTNYTITSGKTFVIQQIVCGAEGDPNEKGSKVEVYYVSGAIEHLIERVYVTGTTQYGIYPDTSQTRSGLALLSSGTEQIRIKRVRLGGSALEIDAVVRGYEK